MTEKKTAKATELTIDRFIHELVNASGSERKEFCRRMAMAGVSAEELTKAAETISEIAMNINDLNK